MSRPRCLPRLVSTMPSARLADLGIVEEQLVEIAHPVEQQAVRIGGLDLDILLHHRRDARRRVGRGGSGESPAGEAMSMRVTLADGASAFTGRIGRAHSGCAPGLSCGRGIVQQSLQGILGRLVMQTPKPARRDRRDRDRRRRAQRAGSFALARAREVSARYRLRRAQRARDDRRGDLVLPASAPAR